MKKRQRFIKNINRICGIVGGVVFLGEFLLILLGCMKIISNVTLIIGIVCLAFLWWIVFGIKYFAERKLINEIKAWAQKVVDANYYCGKQITVDCRKGVWFSGPEDKWFVRKFTARCREVFQNTGMKIYYNYRWIRM